MWLDLAEELGLTATAPASPEAIAAAEAAVGCPLPAALRDLLLATDGLEDEYGGEVVFSAAQIAEQNAEMRAHPDFPELYMPFAPLLFFGAEGNGDLFAFRILSVGADEDATVFEWDHETDSRVAVSASLERYLRGERWYGD